MSIARVTMHEYHEEGMDDKIEELSASVVDEYFPNLEQVIYIKTGPTSAISSALYPSFKEAEKNLGDRTKMVEHMAPYVNTVFSMKEWLQKNYMKRLTRPLKLPQN